MQTEEMKPGRYRYIPGVMQYSAGVAAMDGYAIVRERFSRPVPMVKGFDLICKRLEEVGRPKAAVCACELRSPGQFSEKAFADFNRVYADKLREWDIMEGNNNPVARSNVCPARNPPAEPSFHAFSYTVPSKDSTATFVIAG